MALPWFRPLSSQQAVCSSHVLLSRPCALRWHRPSALPVVGPGLPQLRHHAGPDDDVMYRCSAVHEVVVAQRARVWRRPCPRPRPSGIGRLTAYRACRILQAAPYSEKKKPLGAFKWTPLPMPEGGRGPYLLFSLIFLFCNISMVSSRRLVLSACCPGNWLVPQAVVALARGVSRRIQWVRLAGLTLIDAAHLHESYGGSGLVCLQTQPRRDICCMPILVRNCRCADARCCCWSAVCCADR